MGSIFRRFPLCVRGAAFALLFFLLPAFAVGQNCTSTTNGCVQLNSNSASVTAKSISIPFQSQQTAGNLNIVVIGWGDSSSSVASVTDSDNNQYVLVAGTNATVVNARVSQAIYYAKNIKGTTGTNTVTVTFNQTPASEDVRILEYSGVDTVNPVDTAGGNFGTATTADSGLFTTNSAQDLLIGAGSATGKFVAPPNGAGAGYTEQSFAAISGFGDLVEDQVVSATGPYNATGNVASGGWAMQFVAFRLSGQTPPAFGAPTITSNDTASGPDAGGTSFTLTGTNFEPGATVVFDNGTITASAVNCTVGSTTSITCITPAFAIGPATITVTNVDGQSSAAFSGFSFVASTPVINSVAPTAGSTNGGTKITIKGNEFNANATVTIGGVPADNVSVQALDTITASVPAHSAGAANVVVTNPGGLTGTLSNGFSYSPAAGISFVQLQSLVSLSGSTATATYPQAQQAGDLNVVIIGWANTTAQVQPQPTGVTDSAGNTYVQALNPVAKNGITQAIYYAKNIKAAASNVVTVTFTASATTPDLRILEYSGADTANPLDTATSAFSTATGTAADSGPLTTTFASEVVIAAFTPTTNIASGGSGFTTVNLPTSGDYVEHKITSAIGTVDATATLKTAGAWVAQTVAFRASQAVLQPNFAFSASPGSIAVAAGSSASYTVTVTPQNGFSSAVALSVTCPANLQITCSITPNNVTPGSSPVTAILKVNTTAATATLFAPQGRQLLPLYALFLPLPGIALAGAGLGSSRRHKLGIGASIVLLFLLLLLLLGCGGGGSSSGGGGGGGGGGSGTPAGTYNITVMATSGQLQHTAQITLTVQ